MDIAQPGDAISISCFDLPLQMRTWTSTCPSTGAATWTWSGCPARRECWTTWAWPPATRTPSPSPATTWRPSWRNACGSSGRWGERWAGSWARSCQILESSWRSDIAGGIFTPLLQRPDRASVFLTWLWIRSSTPETIPRMMSSVSLQKQDSDASSSIRGKWPQVLDW